MSSEEESEINATELQLLSAMAVDDTTTELKDYVAKAGKSLAEGTKKFASREEIIEALKSVSDPEIMINIWDLGLVYKIVQKENGDVVFLNEREFLFRPFQGFALFDFGRQSLPDTWYFF